MLFDHAVRFSPNAILDWYALCSEGLLREKKEAYTHLYSGAPLPEYLRRVLMPGATPAEVEAYFASCVEELDLNVLLTFVAATEARIRNDAAKRSIDNGNYLGARLEILYKGFASLWGVPFYDRGIMQEWKEYTKYLCPANLSSVDRDRILNEIGELKNLLGIRHWVAHGRYWELKRSMKSYPPGMVAKKIGDVIGALQRLAVAGMIAPFP